MAGRTYSKEEVDNLVVALESHVREVHEIAANAAAQAKSATNFHAYRTFREKAGEFETFSILIQGRLNRMESGPDGRLQDRFDQLTSLTFKELIRASIKF